jgi:hypothetical protein
MDAVPFILLRVGFCEGPNYPSKMSTPVTEYRARRPSRMGAMEDSGKDDQGRIPREGPREYIRKLFASIEKDYKKEDSKSGVD